MDIILVDVTAPVNVRLVFPLSRYRFPDIVLAPRLATEILNGASNVPTAPVVLNMTVPAPDIVRSVEPLEVMAPVLNVMVLLAANVMPAENTTVLPFKVRL